MLLMVNDKLLINPEYISSVEISEIRGNQVVIVWAHNRSYSISGDSGAKLLNDIKLLDQNEKKQFFAG